MAVNVSPGVYTKIIDLSTYVQSVPSTVGFIPFISRFGPDNQLILTSNEAFYTDFGVPNINYCGKEYGQGHYVASSFLRESEALYVVRCLPPDATWANLAVRFHTGVTQRNNVVLTKDILYKNMYYIPNGGVDVDTLRVYRNNILLDTDEYDLMGYGKIVAFKKEPTPRVHVVYRGDIISNPTVTADFNLTTEPVLTADYNTLHDPVLTSSYDVITNYPVTANYETYTDPTIVASYEADGGISYTDRPVNKVDSLNYTLDRADINYATLKIYRNNVELNPLSYQVDHPTGTITFFNTPEDRVVHRNAPLTRFSYNSFGIDTTGLVESTLSLQHNLNVDPEFQLKSKVLPSPVDLLVNGNTITLKWNESIGTYDPSKVIDGKAYNHDGAFFMLKLYDNNTGKLVRFTDVFEQFSFGNVIYDGRTGTLTRNLADFEAAPQDDGGVTVYGTPAVDDNGSMGNSLRGTVLDGSMFFGVEVDPVLGPMGMVLQGNGSEDFDISYQLKSGVLCNVTLRFEFYLPFKKDETTLHTVSELDALDLLGSVEMMVQSLDPQLPSLSSFTINMATGVITTAEEQRRIDSFVDRPVEKIDPLHYQLDRADINYSSLVITKDGAQVVDPESYTVDTSVGVLTFAQSLLEVTPKTGVVLTKETDTIYSIPDTNIDYDSFILYIHGNLASTGSYTIDTVQNKVVFPEKIILKEVGKILTRIDDRTYSLGTIEVDASTLKVYVMGTQVNNYEYLPLLGHIYFSDYIVVRENVELEAVKDYRLNNIYILPRVENLNFDGMRVYSDGVLQNPSTYELDTVGRRIIFNEDPAVLITASYSYYNSLETYNYVGLNFDDELKYLIESQTSSPFNCFVFYAIGRGEWYNNFKIKISRDVNPYNEGIYIVDIFKRQTFVDNLSEQDTDEGNFEIIESFSVSMDYRQLDSSGENLFIEDVINKYSRYIKVAADKEMCMRALRMNLDFSEPFASGPVYLRNGSSGSLFNSSGFLNTEVAKQIITRAYNGTLLKTNGTILYDVLDTDDYYFNIVLDGGYPTDVKIAGIYTLVTTRRDCVGIIDNGDNSTPEAALSKRNNVHTFNTRYLALYEPYSKIYDSFTGRDIWITPVYHMANLIPYTDNVTNVWWAAAGFNRGTVPTIKELRFSPLLGDRDRFYLAQINPIVKFNVGYTVWGQLTTQKRPSALQDLNIVRLILYCKRALEQYCKYYIFELNDNETWQSVKQDISSFLREVQSERGLYSFDVEVGATDYELKSKQFHVNVTLVPTRVVEKINLNFYIK